MSATTSWPKVFPALTAEQRRISDDFMQYWHEVLPKKYSVIDTFNHTYPTKHRPADFQRTLEIGAGLGEHLEYEKLSPQQEENYHALELRPNLSEEIKRRFPRVNVITGDCQETLPFAEGYFDRVLAIHVLEHLPNLPAAIREVHRVCNKEKGHLAVVIPCEGSMAYTLARRISAQRIFEKRYGQSYRWFIEREHINLPHEILAELHPYFTITSRSFFPIPVPMQFCNLVIVLCLKPRVIA